MSYKLALDLDNDAATGAVFLQHNLPPCSIYLDILRQGLRFFKQGEIKKLIVRLESSPDGKTERLDDVLIVPAFFDAARYARLALGPRGKMVADAVRAVYRQTATRQGWPPDALDAAYASFVARGFLPVGTLGRAVRSPDKRVSASVRWECGHRLEASVYFRSRQGSSTVAFACFAPLLWALESAVRGLRWVGPDTVHIQHENPVNFWIVPRHGERPEFFALAAEQGSAHHQYIQGVNHLEGDGVVPDREVGLRWLECAARAGFGRAQRRLQIESQTTGDLAT